MNSGSVNRRITRERGDVLIEEEDRMCMRIEGEDEEH
jgi:hypothetical protein